MLGTQQSDAERLWTALCAHPATLIHLLSDVGLNAGLERSGMSSGAIDVLSPTAVPLGLMQGDGREVGSDWTGATGHRGMPSLGAHPGDERVQTRLREAPLGVQLSSPEGLLHGPMGASAGACGMPYLPASRLDDGAGATASLYVKNLPPEADELLLYRKFAPFGALLNCKVLTEARTNRCRGVGFVNYVHHACALCAVHHLHGTRISEGRSLCVCLQAPREVRAAAAAAAAAKK